jgi:adenosylcobinamide-GDP ribazoletransferase
MSAAGGERDPTGIRANSTSSFVDQLRLAASFLTILPLLDERPRPDEEVAASFRWFPLVGFLIGGVLALADYALRDLLNPAARGFVVIIALVVITGAVHLDGLADTADALGAGRDRLRALAIMRDSRIGTFGAIALFFVLTLKLAALADAAHAARYRAIFLAPGLARWVMVIVADGMPYLREAGAGSSLLQSGKSKWRIASLIAGAGVLAARSSSGVAALVIALLLSLILRAGYRRWLGGVTGDLIGAAGELAETIVLLVVAN